MLFSARRLHILITLIFFGIPSISNTYLRVMGGQNADYNEYPYVLPLLNAVSAINSNITIYVPMCTASVIKPKWTLAAQHCSSPFIPKYNLPLNIANLDNSKLVVKQNEKIEYKWQAICSIQECANQTGYRRVLSYATIPGSSSRFGTLEDILLLKTEDILDLPKYGRISVIDFHTLSGHEALIIGYGKQSTNLNKQDSNRTALQMSKVLIKNCAKEDHRLYPMICTVHACNKHSTVCPGDSGGPLVHPLGIVGVATAIDFVQCSWLNMKYRSNKAGYFTPISLYSDWINNVISG